MHKPKLLEWSGCDDFDRAAFIGAFFHGVAAHEKGSEVWNRCLDESK